jgi:ubiquinone biosynthesis protein COQ4
MRSIRSHRYASGPTRYACGSSTSSCCLIPPSSSRLIRLSSSVSSSRVSSAPRSLPSSSPHLPPAGDSCISEWDATYAASHVPLSLPQRLLLASSSAVLALLDTHRADLVAALSETTVTASTLQTLADRIAASPFSQSLLTDKPRITGASIAHLSSLPPASLGFQYHSFLSSHRFSPASRPLARFLPSSFSPSLAYVLQRYREAHDVWHVLTGCETTVAGELGQKAFEWEQTRLPMAGLAATVGPVRLRGAEALWWWREMRPWALRCGREAELLLAVYWEKYWEMDAEEMRRMLRVEKAPPYRG